MLPLCSKCCMENNEDFCQHDDKEQAFTGTWPTIEIEKGDRIGVQTT